MLLNILEIAFVFSLLLPSTTVVSASPSPKRNNLRFEAKTIPPNYFNTLEQTYYPPNANCENYFVPVDITSENFEFNAAQWETLFELEDFLSIATTRAGANYPSPLSGPTTQNATYQIAATFCSPQQKNGKEKTVILATHGIGPARAHWNSQFEPEEFNFVQWAVQEGYSVFFYDRLGTGASQKVSGYTAQISMAVAIIQRLSDIVRSGQYTGDIGVPSKVALMGFSFGSFATHVAISQRPEIADAVILTAIGFNITGLNVNGLVRSFVPRIANDQDPVLYGDLDTGYVTWVDEIAQIHNYFKRPNFSSGAAKFAEVAKAPFAITEFLTLGGLLANPPDAGNYDKPVLHIAGEFDYIFCDGFCPGIYDEPSETIYKNANPFKRVIHPGASHNINLHFNATGVYQTITDFLTSSGL